VDFGDRANGRSRVARGCLLFDGNRRRETFDGVDIRFFHLIEELARIGGERLHVTTLPFSKKGVEGQRGFARPGNTGDHHQAVTGYCDIDVGEIVLARAANDDLFVHAVSSPRPN
jgi:hypothetical protein